MRIAWLGPEPSLDGGVPYAATQILDGLAGQGVEVDAFIAPVLAPYGQHFRNRPGLRIIEERVPWNWDRWYSRDPLLATATSLGARVRTQQRLLARLAEMHRASPYDVVYQFSQFEVPWLRSRAGTLPPVVVHPEVHAAGELRWHRRERQLALRCGGRWRTDATTMLLAARAITQKRHARAVSAIIAPSAVFARLIASDYGVAAKRLHVVPNPIDVNRYRPGPHEKLNGESLELLFVSRMSMRKGVEMIVALSHRLAADPGAFHLRIIGTGALFSDYRPLLEDLNTDVATYEGPRSSSDLAALYRAADIVLQPSHYEPFALTVAEALASGTPVVVSDAVGAGENLPKTCCRRFPAGDLDAMEIEVRRLAARLSHPPQREEIRAAARSEAERRFSPNVVCGTLRETLAAVASRGQ